jgi:hypothetical protein
MLEAHFLDVVVIFDALADFCAPVPGQGLWYRVKALAKSSHARLEPCLLVLVELGMALGEALELFQAAARGAPKTSVLNT